MASDATAESAGTRLVHPVYLDVPMMISFLAALQGGVAFEDTLTRRDSRTSNRERDLGVKVRVPSLVSLLGFDASGRMGRSDGDEASEEIQAVRQHTAASLFNALYSELDDRDLVTRLNAATDLDGISPGDVVEISGEFVGNPLEPVLAFFKQVVPYLDIAGETNPGQLIDAAEAQREIAGLVEAAEALKVRADKAERSGNPAMKAQAIDLRHQAGELQRQADEGLAVLGTVVAESTEQQTQEQGLRMLNQVSDDLETTPVHDTVINAGDFKAVLTMSSEFFTEATRAYLRAGVFHALGKVTRTLKPGEELNLLRRTVLGVTEPETSRGIISSVVEDSALQLETFDPIIESPAVQVLPLAVFI